MTQEIFTAADYYAATRKHDAEIQELVTSIGDSIDNSTILALIAALSIQLCDAIEQQCEEDQQPTPEHLLGLVLYLADPRNRTRVANENQP